MPVKRRVSKRKVGISLAEWEWMSGEEQPDANPFERLTLEAVGHVSRAASYERARQIWEEWRERALRVWLRHSPGTRPQPWWIFDAPAEEFRVVETETDEGGVLYEVTESEAAFLRRHKLLTDAERRRLPNDAFEPVGDDGPQAALIQRKRCAPYVGEEGDA